MQLKITTPDIQLEYSDEYSMICKESKDHLLEILKRVHEMTPVKMISTEGSGNPNSIPPSLYCEDVFGKLSTRLDIKNQII